MRRLRLVLSRLAGFFGRGRADRRLDEEIRAHLDALSSDYERCGLSPDDARRAAGRAFGGVTQMREAYNDERGWTVAANVLRDAQYAVRLLGRNPAFAATAAVSLGLAIGAATSVYGVLDAVFVQPMPVVRPHELVLLKPQVKGERWILPNPIFEELRRRQQVFTDMFAVNDTSFLKTMFPDDDGPGYVQASMVSGSFFRTLGLTPSLGRLLTDADDEIPDTSSCAAVLDHRFWSRRFHSEPSVLGLNFQVGQRTCVIVGVGPEAFRSYLTGFTPDVWLPLRPLRSREDLENRNGQFFSGVFGRLRPGITARQAEAPLTALYRTVHQTAPPDKPIASPDLTMRLTSGAQGIDALQQQFAPAFRLLLALVCVVLVVAGLNVANLNVARGLARATELETRCALGATVGRLMSQLTIEGALVVAAGIAIGMIVASFSTAPLASFVTLSYRTIDLEVVPNYRVGVMVALIGAVLTIGLAAVPAWRTARGLGSGPGRSRGTTIRQRAMRTLVVVQFVFSVLLLGAAGWLVQTVVGLSRVDPGFRPERVTMLSVSENLPVPADPEEALQVRAMRQANLLNAIRAIPGVEAAAVSWLDLFGSNDVSRGIVLRDELKRTVRVNYVSSGYFETMGMDFRSGRAIAADDDASRPRVVVVNQAMAAFFDGEVLGQSIAIDATTEGHRPFTIVGVLRDSKYASLREATARPMMWIPLAQLSMPAASVALRIRPGGEGQVVQQAREALTSSRSNLILQRATSLSSRVDASVALERLLLGFALGFGGLAVLLAAIGLYGTLSQAILRRRRELGVRLALGAEPRALALFVIRDALRLAGIAVLIGVPLVLLAGYGLRAVLFGVSPTDPVVIVSSVSIVCLVALVTACLPARHASRLDPLAALRSD